MSYGGGGYGGGRGGGGGGYSGYDRRDDYRSSYSNGYDSLRFKHCCVKLNAFPLFADPLRSLLSLTLRLKRCYYGPPNSHILHPFHQEW